MRVLVLTVTAGEGHNQCAAAIAETLSRRGAKAETLDALKYINPTIGEGVAKGYIVATEYSPPLWGKAYNTAASRNYADKNSILKVASVILHSKLKKYIYDFKPDAIVCTHIIALHLLRKVTGMPKIGVLTDFSLHPFFEQAEYDYLVTASEMLNYQLMKKQIPVNKALPFGIPVKEKFSEKMDKSAARKVLGIPDKRTVFVMSGGHGYGKMTKTVRALDGVPLDFQILCVCGNNKSAKKDVESMLYKKDVYVYGFVNNIDVFMDASDCIITKPGGLSTSEAMAKKLPLVLSTPIPGLENRNAEFLLNNGLAVMSSSTTPVDECIYQLFTNKSRLESLSHAYENYAKPHAARDLCEFILSLKQET